MALPLLVVKLNVVLRPVLADCVTVNVRVAPSLALEAAIEIDGAVSVLLTVPVPAAVEIVALVGVDNVDVMVKFAV